MATRDGLENETELTQTRLAEAYPAMAEKALKGCKSIQLKEEHVVFGMEGHYVPVRHMEKFSPDNGEYPFRLHCFSNSTGGKHRKSCYTYNAMLLARWIYYHIKMTPSAKVPEWSGEMLKDFNGDPEERTTKKLRTVLNKVGFFYYDFAAKKYVRISRLAEVLGADTTDKKATKAWYKALMESPTPSKPAPKKAAASKKRAREPVAAESSSPSSSSSSESSEDEPQATTLPKKRAKRTNPLGKEVEDLKAKVDRLLSLMEKSVEAHERMSDMLTALGPKQDE